MSRRTVKQNPDHDSEQLLPAVPGFELTTLGHGGSRPVVCFSNSLVIRLQLEEEERARIQRMKEEERARATAELEAWKEKEAAQRRLQDSKEPRTPEEACVTRAAQNSSRTEGEKGRRRFDFST